TFIISNEGVMLSILISFFICGFLVYSFFIESQKHTKTYIQQTIIFSTLLFIAFFLTGSWLLQIIIPGFTFILIDKFSWRKNIKNKKIVNQTNGIIICKNCNKKYFSYRDICPYCSKKGVIYNED
ncbi:unnamed protein product, partial [marine sediment metagenome]